ncbi:MAG: D-alanyl-D-alanine carboxypeptidase/D-alanyl-D-alanine-endopeptidase [Bdellovibrionales bacterium]|nr:D-alanyl-D-alanine carboxypeptidase/D-alanyl-D-alanine-endopeptidase [Bdellovibrionales bacterium]
MRRFTSVATIASLLLAGGTASAAESGLVKALKALQKNGARVSAEIVNLTNTRTLLKVSEDKPLNPASSIKLFTAYAALKRLGINFQFKTEFYVGDDQSLCVKGDGDPSFVMEDLYLVVEALKRKGLEKYNGKIVVDASAFDDEFYPEDRSDQDSERAYNAPISGLNFNYNTITAFVYPTKKGQRARVALDFPFSFVEIKNKVTTGGGTDVTWDKKGDGPREIVNLDGKISENAEDWKKPFRVRDPATGFADAFAKMLAQGGILASAKPEFSKKSCSGKPFYVYQSKPLSFVVQLMDKYSNNFIADSLVKKLDQVVNKHPGTAAGGLHFIRDELQKVGINLDAKGRKMVSGSGLTGGNAVAANDFNSLLKVINREKVLLPEIFASLPIAGLDGTLKRKYGNSEVKERLRGKTGTLSGVQSLVGIYPNKEGEWLAISIIVNGGSIPEGEVGKFLSAQE